MNTCDGVRIVGRICGGEIYAIIGADGTVGLCIGPGDGTGDA